MEELLQRQMTQDVVLSSLLTQYSGQPAIFYQKAPMDEDRGWEELQYPRLHYNLDFSYDAERKQAGTLTVDVWACSLNETADGRSPDRVLSQQVEQLISGVFYRPQGGTPLCAIWRESLAFLGSSMATYLDSPTVETFGISVTFDLLAYPKQETFSPDPILGLNRWVKTGFPTVKLVEELPEIFRPTDKEPVIYWRFGGADRVRESFACTWYLGQFHGHISCESLEERNRWARAILEGLHLGNDFVLEDGSFFRVENSMFRHDTAPLSEGQVTIGGEFGVLSQKYQDLTRGFPLNHGHFTAKIPKNGG